MAHHLFHSFVLEVQNSRSRARDVGNGFRLPEQTYPNLATPIDDRTVCAVAERIAEHAQRHGLDRVEVALRGTEPLLIGLSGLRWIFHTFRSALDGVAEIGLSLQTTGVPLDERFAELFLAAEVQVGVVLAGGPAAHERQRRFGPKANHHQGGGNYDATLRAVRLLCSPDYRPVFGALLCPVDVVNDPVQVFQDLAELDPPKIDLLLPQAGWEHPPPEAVIGRTPYGDWLVALFDHWYGAPPRVGIRLFEQVMHTLLRGVTPAEAALSAVPNPVVIDAGGSIERSDALAPAFAIAGEGGFDVLEHSLDDVRDALTRAQAPSGDSPAAQLPAAGNPSVYARDLARLVTHIQSRMAVDLSAQPQLVDVR